MAVHNKVLKMPVSFDFYMLMGHKNRYGDAKIVWLYIEVFVE